MLNSQSYPFQCNVNSSNREQQIHTLFNLSKHYELISNIMN